MSKSYQDNNPSLQNLCRRCQKIVNKIQTGSTPTTLEIEDLQELINYGRLNIQQAGYDISTISNEIYRKVRAK